MKIKPIKFKGFSKKKIIKLLVIVGVIAIGAVGVYNIPAVKKKFAAAPAVQKRTANVTKGDLNVIVTGSGPVYEKTKVKINAKVAGTISKVYFKQGDSVKAGDLICELDSSDFGSSLTSGQNSLTQNQLDRDNIVQDLNNLNVYAPFSGQITGIKFSKGDNAPKDGAIMTLADTSKLKVTVPFNGADIGSVAVGQSASIMLSDLMESVGGKVTYVNRNPYVSSSGVKLYSVEIQITNPGAIAEGMNASAEVNTSNGEKSSAGTGALAYVNKTTIKSEVGGKITNMVSTENEYVKAGALLVSLQNDDLIRSKQSADLKVSSASQSLQDSQNKLKDYKIYATVDGVIVNQSISAGDSVKANDTVSTIADLTNMQFDVPVDELDVAKLNIGQEVNVTFDALPATETSPIKGKVIDIAIDGTASNGITTYPVTISVDSTDKIRSGMNANAEIMISNKKDVLLIPLEAIKKMDGKNYVFLMSNNPNRSAGNSALMKRATGGSGTSASKSGNSSSKSKSSSGSSGSSSNNRKQGGATGGGSGMPGGAGGTGGSGMPNVGSMFGVKSTKQTATEYYAGTELKEVVLGDTNDNYVEVISGLEEGQTLVMPQLK